MAGIDPGPSHAVFSSDMSRGGSEGLDFGKLKFKAGKKSSTYTIVRPVVFKPSMAPPFMWSHIVSDVKEIRGPLNKGSHFHKLRQH